MSISYLSLFLQCIPLSTHDDIRANYTGIGSIKDRHLSATVRDLEPICFLFFFFNLGLRKGICTRIDFCFSAPKDMRLS